MSPGTPHGALELATRVRDLGFRGVYVDANAVAPAARTSMTTAVEEMAERMKAPEDGSFDYWAPENVSSLITWLASAASVVWPGSSLPRPWKLKLPVGGLATSIPKGQNSADSLPR